ncbi:MAG: hypothetical protein V7722_04675 [Porticoccus sp.]
MVEGKQQLIDAIAFNVDTEVWPNSQAEKVQLVYKLDINVWQGRELVQLMVESISL